ncbi:hypothetical protein F5Y10DRAFT_271194 [Nemania abortiva]|nr:hypothetical protein F5Y10DRAFT_271194 [Nemania abortiva]
MASIIKFPREILWQIYDYLIQFEIDHRVIEEVTNDHLEQAGWGNLTGSPPARPIPIPWVNLRSTCRFFKLELAAYMARDSFLRDTKNRTYTLEALASEQFLKPSVEDYVHIHYGQYEGVLKHLTWRQIPCFPHEIDTLRINITIDVPQYRFRRVSDMEDMMVACRYAFPISRQLYCAVNSFLNNGPLFVRSSQLYPKIRPRRVELNYVLDPKSPDPNRQVGFPNTAIPSTRLQDICFRWEAVINETFLLFKEDLMIADRCIDSISTVERYGHREANL